MSADATRRRLIAAALALSAAPVAAQAQVSLPKFPKLPKLPNVSVPHLGLPPAPKLPFTGGAPKVDLAALVADTGAPALGGVVVNAKGLDFLGASGLRRVGEAVSVTPDDLWHLGGCTQTMTALICGRLAEAGKLSLTGRLPALFPGATLDPAWADTRLEDVLAHRAGFTDTGVVTPEFVGRAHADLRPADVQRAEFAAALLAKPPARPPGGFDLSNAGYVVVAAALERLTGKPFETLAETELFAPAGMNTAGFGAPSGASAAAGHRLGRDGKLHPVDTQGLADLPSLFAPAAGAHMSLTDWARFARLFLTDGGGLIGADTLRRLLRPWGGADGDMGAGGWQVIERRAWAQGPVFFAEGSNGLWRAQAEIAPERGIAVLVVCNAEEGGGADAVKRAALELERAYGAG
jgi:CubicO group peptidase (beta-lactamase class C family)